MLITLVISAWALTFAFAPFGLRFLAYFTFIPMFLSIHRYPYKKIFLYGLIFGFAFALSHLWWLYFLIVPVEPITKTLLYLGVTVLFAYLSLYTAVFAVVTKYLGLIFAPLVWAVLEFLRTKSEIGFPWGFLGYSQTPYIPIVQLASIFGIYGLSAWVIWINLLIFWIFQKKHKLTFLVLLILSFVLPIGFGLIRINAWKNPELNLKVALVQPNVGPNEKGDYENRQRLLDELLDLVNQAREHKPDLIILPETATLVDITRFTDLRDTIQKIVDSNNVYLFTGTPLYAPGSPIYYNGAVLFTPGQIGFTEIYRKIHLVPFSEKIPYADKIPLLKRIETGDMGDCTQGKEFTIFTLDAQRSTFHAFSCLICFESIFPDLTREFTKRGADMLVNITNDGWFGKTPGPYQHCELAILRSVENGVPLVRCANNGISLIADPYARIKSKTKLFTQAVVIDSVPSPIKPTFYRKYGDVFIYFAIGIIAVGIIIKPIRRARRWLK